MRSPLRKIILIIYLFEDKNTAQTDEEKQRERQRNEREQKNAELEAQQIKVNINCTYLEIMNAVI